ncbi:MAG: Hsp20/alpha crystallin family protein, partial [Melioribacteraceae bacterium]|nr:Hsp20/alpha crystallin family protein [Melioribacteraceae bacterium]
EAEMPGVKKDEIKISIKDNVLTIEGEKKFSEEKKEKEYYRSERSYGAFKRSFTLPEDVDVENVKAKFEDGILSLSMNKIEPKQPEVKEIKVN